MPLGVEAVVPEEAADAQVGQGVVADLGQGVQGDGGVLAALWLRFESIVFILSPQEIEALGLGAQASAARFGSPKASCRSRFLVGRASRRRSSATRSGVGR